MIQNINENLLLFFNSLNEYSIIEMMVICFSDTPIFFIPIFLISMWLYYTYKKIENEELLLNIFYATSLALIISLIIQQFITVERPEEAIKGVGKLLLSHIPDASFPSDHATVSFAFLFALYFSRYFKIALLFTPFVLIMNTSRVIAGVHWPFDVLAGMIIGLFSAYIMIYILSQQKLVKNVNKLIIKHVNKLIIKVLHYIKYIIYG